MSYDNFTFGGCKVDTPEPAHGKRRAEVDVRIDEIYNSDGMAEPLLRSLARTLADEIDALTAENERIKQNHGCARHQHTTQFCAEAAQRDAEYKKLEAECDGRGAIILRLLELLLPGVPPPHKPCECFDCRTYQINEGRYARACEIAGRME